MPIFDTPEALQAHRAVSQRVRDLEVVQQAAGRVEGLLMTTPKLDQAEVERLYRKILDRDDLTADEAAYIWTAEQTLPPEIRTYTYILTRLERELAKGHRCVVCGNTAAQSAAIGYDCPHEC